MCFTHDYQDQTHDHVSLMVPFSGECHSMISNSWDELIEQAGSAKAGSHGYYFSCGVRHSGIV